MKIFVKHSELPSLPPTISSINIRYTDKNSYFARDLAVKGVEHGKNAPVTFNCRSERAGAELYL